MTDLRAVLRETREYVLAGLDHPTAALRKDASDLLSVIDSALAPPAPDAITHTLMDALEQANPGIAADVHWAALRDHANGEQVADALVDPVGFRARMDAMNRTRDPNLPALGTSCWWHNDVVVYEQEWEGTPKDLSRYYACLCFADEATARADLARRNPPPVTADTVDADRYRWLRAGTRIRQGLLMDGGGGRADSDRVHAATEIVAVEATQEAMADLGRSLMRSVDDHIEDHIIDTICQPNRAKRWRGDGRQYDRDTVRLVLDELRATPNQDLAYLLDCVESHADKFPVPEHMRALVSKLRGAPPPVEQAPWPDRMGNALFVGDVIQHPGDLSEATVGVDNAYPGNLRWRAFYSDGGNSYLGNQISDRGLAVLVHRAVPAVTKETP